jgi:hypothetical protein
VHEQASQRYASKPKPKIPNSMPPGSLIPDRQLTFSPDLAATIGLEEAILLQGLGELLSGRPQTSQCVALSEFERNFPFWEAPKIRELLARLEALGIINVRHENQNADIMRISAVAAQSTPAADKPKAQAAPKQPSPSSQTSPRPYKSHEPSPERPFIQAAERHWQPSEDLLDLLHLSHGINRQFALSQLPGFSPAPSDSAPDSRFRQHVLSAWRRHQSQHPAFEIAAPPAFDQNWRPSDDALDIMTGNGVDLEFIDSMRPEFILYWRERGGPPKEVNSKFIGWIRQRWVRFQAGLGHSPEPRPMTNDWEPSEQVFEVLALSNIERTYAKERLGEFRVFWCDSGDLQTSWNSKFLQHVKHQWRWEQGQTGKKGSDHGGQQGRGQSGGEHRTRDRSIADDLSDTSWAN